MTGGRDLTLVTGNPGKAAEARRITGLEIETVAIDLPEIQSLDMREVVAAKAEEAWRRTRRPVIVEEAGLELVAMNDFPGPLVKWMLDAVGADGIARTALALADPAARARCLLLHFDGRHRVLGEGVTEGRLVQPGRGEHGFGWDPVFEPQGETRTFGELDGEAKDAVSHRGRAWRDLLERL